MIHHSNDKENNYILERRKISICLSEDDINLIAEKAAEKAIEKLQKIAMMQMKLFWGIGGVVVALYYWLQSKGLVGKL